MIRIWNQKKKCAPLRRNAFVFCLPVFLLAISSRTFKNTCFFDDSAGLSKKMCAGLRRNDRKKRKSILKRPSPHNQRSKTSKNQCFFLIFLTKSLVIPYQSPGGAEKYTCPLKRKDLAVAFFFASSLAVLLITLGSSSASGKAPAATELESHGSQFANYRFLVRPRIPPGAEPADR